MRLTMLARSAAVGTALTLAAGLSLFSPATAQAADPVTVSIAPIAAITVPTTSATVPVTVNFTGPAPSANTYYRLSDASGAWSSTTLLSTLSANPIKPSVDDPSVSTLNPGTPATYQLAVGPNTSPGTYRVTIPITARTWNGTDWVSTTGVASADFVVNANPAVSQSFSHFWGVGKYSKSFKWRWGYQGPTYVVKAPVTVYYRAAGSKKFVAVGSGRTNANGNASFTGKKGKIRKKGTVYLAIGAVANSPAFNTVTLPLGR